MKICTQQNTQVTYDQPIRFEHMEKDLSWTVPEQTISSLRLSLTKAQCVWRMSLMNPWLREKWELVAHIHPQHIDYCIRKQTQSRGNTTASRFHFLPLVRDIYSTICRAASPRAAAGLSVPGESPYICRMIRAINIIEQIERVCVCERVFHLREREGK